MLKEKLINFLEKLENPINFDFQDLNNFTFFKLKNRKLFHIIEPIKNLKPIKINELLFIDKPKKILIENTKRFLNSGKANNVLLWGERGCGKSSLIKSIVYMFKDENLKLILIKKSEISFLEDTIDALLNLPYKFIIFLDDLSFTTIDDNFISLKSILDIIEMNSSNNLLVYATSNRRHLVEEKFISEDIIHENDAISEIISLSDRFGITFGFYKFNKEQFLEIAKNYAKKENVLEKFNKNDALNFAMKKGGFTGRVAYQYVLTL